MEPEIHFISEFILGGALLYGSFRSPLDWFAYTLKHLFELPTVDGVRSFLLPRVSRP